MDACEVRAVAVVLSNSLRVLTALGVRSSHVGRAE